MAKGLSIITCNREDYFKKIIESVPFDKFDKVYVVDASDEESAYAEKYKSKGFEVIQKGRKVVGVAKNMGIEAMIEQDIEHMFLMEDDVIIKNPDVAEKYIETANATGIWGTLAHNTHGDGNFDHDGNAIIKNTVKYDNGLGLDFYLNSVQPWTYIHRNIIRHVGLFDEKYVNAIEHLDHYKLQEIKKLGSFYWWFPSPLNCQEDMVDVDEKHDGSIIRRDEKWEEHLKEGVKLFHSKYKASPFNIPEATEDQMLDRLEFLEQHYAKKL